MTDNNENDLPNIRNRIVEIREMRLGDIAHNPHNWRGHPEHQRAALNEAMQAVGFAGVPLAYHSERTGTLTYVDGHARKEELPDHTAKVAITDLNDEEADLLLVTYDTLTGEAEAKPDELAALLKQTKEMTVNRPVLRDLLERLREREVFDSDEIEFPEYDESVEDEVEFLTCPHCGKQFPK
jgi:LmbE family N-acetylglucosaminyl deacetylase